MTLKQTLGAAFFGLALGLVLASAPAIAQQTLTQTEATAILDGLEQQAAGDEAALVRALANNGISLERMGDAVSEMAILAPLLRQRQLADNLASDADPALVQSVRAALNDLEAGAAAFFAEMEDGEARRQAAEPVVADNLDRIEQILVPALEPEVMDDDVPDDDTQDDDGDNAQ